jgi:hypothetical protein
MMRTIYIKAIFLVLIAGLVALTSCTDDLNTVPLDDDVITSASVYDDPDAYRQVMAKLYAGLALSGQEGPAGNPDISGIDEGFSTYLRQYWKAQELTTDEAVIAWNDGNLRDYHEQDWSATNEFITAMYNRIYYQISLCNEFIRETTDAKLDDRAVSGDLRTQVEFFRAEARFLRAFSYWHAIDMFGDIPFVTEEDPVGAFFPPQRSREEIFNYIESELLAIEDLMLPPTQNEYGRVDQAALWTLLAKLYLNAEVYIGEERYTECLTYCNKVISSPYELHPNYQDLFLADNNTANGIIFPVIFDGLNTRTWGGMTFVVHAAVGGSMDPEIFGIDGGWGGTRTTSAFVDKFPDVTGALDSRAMFHIDGQSLEIEDVFDFTSGYAITKFKNVTSEGVTGSDLTFPDIDYIMFRLADVYLMYAEAVLRGGSGGDQATALTYVNALRERAFGDQSGNISSGQLTLDFILDERARELYWEGHRRTDLVRFGEFSNTDYVWDWKGGVPEGQPVDSKYDLFPLPSSDVAANPNLQQNDQY